MEGPRAGIPCGPRSPAPQDVGIHDVERLRTGEQAAEVLGDGGGVVGLGVVGGAADVGGQHDRVEAGERVVGREELALEVVEPGCRHLAGPERRRPARRCRGARPARC